MTKAFWIKSNNIYDILPDNHISFVIKNPELFALSLDEIRAVYSSFNEKLYTEGKARRAIIKSLFQDGWMRIRERRTEWVEKIQSYR